ncbi:MAG: KpsF/GutQ family sugar-phosphate isomerase [Bacteroidetes bacterium]|nr:KpsF/GutQ family sugar-phosphate isomerase [Bacteroidota bacterium]
MYHLPKIPFNLQQKRTLHSSEEIIAWGRDTIQTELDSVQLLIDRIDADFSDTIGMILASSGRVVVTGIGKSAAIASKIVATLNSTGTPAIFMHAADAVHGDLGMIQQDDIIICLSKSGNTPEIKALVPLLKMAGNGLIAMVGNTTSFLAQQADKILNVSVDKEACPNNLAPTTSTTAQLVMGDALAVCLLKARGFTDRDFARYHPGGALGKKLYLRLKDVAVSNGKPTVKPTDDIRTVILELTQNRLGAVVVMDGEAIVGVITDGDIRRMLEKHEDTKGLVAANIMGTNPVTMDEEELAVEAAKVISERKVSQLITTRNGAYAGMVHIHDLNKEGILL